MAGHNSELTITEDARIAEIVHLRVQEGLSAAAIARRVEMPVETVRKLLGTAVARQAVDQAVRLAADAARIRLSQRAEEVASKMADMALGIGRENESVHLDPTQLKACEAVLDRVGMSGASKPGQVNIGSINVDARQMTPEQKAEAMKIYLEAIGEEDEEK